MIKNTYTEWIVVFAPFVKSKHISRFKYWRLRLRGMLYNRGDHGVHDYGHVYAINVLKRDETTILIKLEQVPSGYDLEVVHVYNKDRAVQELYQAGSNSIISFKKTTSSRFKYVDTIQKGDMCHSFVANLLGVAKKTKSPYQLYKHLINNGAIEYKKD